MADTVEVKINGQVFTGWTDMTIRRSLNDITGGFSLQYVDRWRPTGEDFPLSTMDAVQVAINGELVVTGWVDAVSKSFTGSDYSLSVEGRGRCGDLVDCTAVLIPGSWKDVDPLFVMAELCDPFGIEVASEYSSTDRMREWALDLGETVQDAVTRVARSVGGTPIETPSGDLRIVADIAGDLVELPRAVSVDIDQDVTAVFSDYLVDAQIKGRKGHRRKKTSNRALSQDENVERYRPLLIRTDGPGTNDFAQLRADTERNFRSGDSQDISVEVVGFSDLNGLLFHPGQVTEFIFPGVENTGELLIESVETSVSPSGYTTTMGLVSKTKYSQNAVEVLDL